MRITKVILVGVILACLIGYAVTRSIARARMEAAAKDVLKAQTPEIKLHWPVYSAVFLSGEEANIAVVHSRYFGSFTATDINNSRALGEFVGSRAKEFGKGLIDGLKSEPKHVKELK